jgi:THO complex subunit 3
MLNQPSQYTLKEQLNRYSRLTLQANKTSIHTVRWSPDGGYLAAGGKDRMVNLYRATESDMVPDSRYSGHGHTGDIDEISWNPASLYQFATASTDKSAKIWDIRGIDPIASVRLKNENITVNWSSDGNTIAVADRNDWVSFIDTRMGFKVTKDLKYPFEVNDLVWNKENDLLFITSGDGNVHIISYPELQPTMVIDAFASPCICIRFDNSGKYFAVGSNDAVSSVWCSQNLACISAIDRLEWPIKAISFSHDGKYLASGSEDHFIDISKTKTGEQVMTIDVNAPTLTLDFHPKQHILAYALDEHDHRDQGTVKVVGFPEKERRNEREIRHPNMRM